jgi:ribosome-associated protein
MNAGRRTAIAAVPGFTDDAREHRRGMSRAPQFLVVNSRIRIPLSEFEFRFARSSGPGGQNVNKVNSQAQLRWDVNASSSLPADVAERFRAANRRRFNAEGTFSLSSQRYRDQVRNRRDCLERLRDLLQAAATVPRKRKPTRTPRRAHAKRLSNKRRRAETKQRRRGPGADE